jgi:hypothetical protein
MGSRKKRTGRSRRKRSSLRNIGSRSTKTTVQGGSSVDFSYSDLNPKGDSTVANINPMHATTYVVRYTRMSDGKITNKEVFIQGVNSYKHYMIDVDEDDGEFEETTHKCFQSIPFNSIGDYLNSPYDPTKCGMALDTLGNPQASV